MLMQMITKIGKHKIPRFIYHITNKSNYETMITEGIIRTSRDGLIKEKGIFTTELTNLFKYWGRDNTWNLINRAKKGSEEIVILRIPTNKLDPDKLFIRSQNRLLKWQHSENAKNATKQIPKRDIETSYEDWFTKAQQTLVNAITKQEPESLAIHLTKGTPAKMSSLYKQRKEAIEYIYLDEMDMSYVEKIGELKLDTFKKSSEFNLNYPLKSIFTNLLKGTPEVKSAELFSC